MPLQATVAQAADLIDCELDIIKMELMYPERFGQSCNRSVKPSLSLISKYSNLGVMGMAEILTSLSLLGGIRDNMGKNPSSIAFANSFEQTFGFCFNDIYDRQSELFRRKPCNLTKTLDALKTALTKEYRKRKAAEEKHRGKETK
ncbi:hypothetical protein FACS189431_8460 [Alphaproteobacteria bacterium]|nr:hypothetical protein FACS189431_8460 [Alphaproteobacteria bacterium]